MPHDTNNTTEAAPRRREASALSGLVIRQYPYFKMVEIYGGKDERWKGWHNLILKWGDGLESENPIAGPIDPVMSKRIFEAIEAL